MRILVICNAIALSAFQHMIRIGFTSISRIKYNVIKGKRCFVSLGRIDGHAGRIRQRSAIRTGYRKGKFVPFLEFAACDDLLSF